jgi:hypothetical protein
VARGSAVGDGEIGIRLTNLNIFFGARFAAQKIPNRISSNPGQAKNNPEQGWKRKTGKKFSKNFSRVEGAVAKFSLASFPSRIQKNNPRKPRLSLKKKLPPNSIFVSTEDWKKHAETRGL